jgi:hypothetical protein
LCSGKRVVGVVQSWLPRRTLPLVRLLPTTVRKGAAWTLPVTVENSKVQGHVGAAKFRCECDLFRSLRVLVQLFFEAAAWPVRIHPRLPAMLRWRAKDTAEELEAVPECR